MSRCTEVYFYSLSHQNTEAVQGLNIIGNNNVNNMGFSVIQSSLLYGWVFVPQLLWFSPQTTTTDWQTLYTVLQPSALITAAHARALSASTVEPVDTASHPPLTCSSAAKLQTESPITVFYFTWNISPSHLGARSGATLRSRCSEQDHRTLSPAEGSRL